MLVLLKVQYAEFISRYQQKIFETFKSSCFLELTTLEGFKICKKVQMWVENFPWGDCGGYRTFKGTAGKYFCMMSWVAKLDEFFGGIWCLGRWDIPKNGLRTYIFPKFS